MQEYKFYKVADTPDDFDIEKFKSGDIEQVKLYKNSKTVYHKTPVKYEDILKEDSPNFAREVPEDCMFIDFDDPKEAVEMYDIINRAKKNCLILETTKGYQFLFRKPDFYKKEMTRATNWFGYKFDTKGWTKGKSPPVQIIKVCGMLRKEVRSWDLDTPTTIFDKIDIEELDVLPFWLWGKLSEKDLHKSGKTGDRTKDDATEYTLTDNPFTQLMKMGEGGRHNHIVERCSYFALSNGFEMGEFKELITAIHDQYLVKIGTPMPDSDLFGDLPERWADYEETLTSSDWIHEEKERKWKKVKEKKDEKIDERRAAEWLYTQFDFYGRNPRLDGTYTELVYREKEGEYKYQTDITRLRHTLKGHSDQNFKKTFFTEVEEQLMQLCAENSKIIARNDKYVIAKNKVMSCILPESYDFAWLDTKPSTDVVLPWNWYSQEWVDEHEEDLGKNIKNFIKELSRDASGKPQPEVEQWLYIIAGACMVPGNQLQKIVILSGGGQNGKSLYTSLIRLCLGSDMFNESKIFDSNPQDSFWGAGLDKGIFCVIDDLPQRYNREAFSYIKGAITGTDTVEINEKFKPKRRLDVLPQIIACTNFEFELYDKSEGMKRRVLILPTEFHVDDDIKDRDLEFKLVLNTTDPIAIAKYKMSADAFSAKGEKCMYMYTEEKSVLDSLIDGSLAWFANYSRYMYFKWLAGEIIPGESEKMKTLHGHTFKNKLQIELEEFIKWYVDSKCGTDNSRDLSKANIHFNKLYPVYESYCEGESKEKMKEGQFRIFCRPAIINLGYQIIDKKMKKKNGKKEAYRYVVFGKEV